MNPLLAGGAALVALFFAFGGKASAAERASRDIEKHVKTMSRGAVVQFTTTERFVRHDDAHDLDVTNTEVVESLDKLASMASAKLGIKVTPEEFLLATLMRSEAGQEGDLARAAIGHAALADAWRRGMTLSQRLIPRGKLGGQKDGRYAATGQPPTARDIELAHGILTGKIQNPVPGAVQWDSPSAQDALARRGEYKADAEEITKRRMKDRTVAYLPGVDPRKLRLWVAST